MTASPHASAALKGIKQLQWLHGHSGRADTGRRVSITLDQEGVTAKHNKGNHGIALYKTEMRCTLISAVLAGVFVVAMKHA